jgi:hypothetical protein
MGMWSNYMDAYQDSEREQQAAIELEKTNASHLLGMNPNRERENGCTE